MEKLFTSAVSREILPVADKRTQVGLSLSPGWLFLDVSILQER